MAARSTRSATSRVASALRERAKLGQLAVPLVQPEAVADEQLVRDGEADVAERQVVDEPPVRAIEERADLEARGGPDGKLGDEAVERQARVYDILDEQDVTAG